MTDEQKKQFNKMYAALKTIAEDFRESEDLIENGEDDYGLDAETVLAMSYENMHGVATHAIWGIEPIK